jgi:CheY-like chemotaxis protein
MDPALTAMIVRILEEKSNLSAGTVVRANTTLPPCLSIPDRSESLPIVLCTGSFSTRSPPCRRRHDRSEGFRRSDPVCRQSSRIGCDPGHQRSDIRCISPPISLFSDRKTDGAARRWVTPNSKREKQEVRTPNKKRILVVDDEEFLRTLLIDELTGAGYTVTGADTGESALATIRTEQIDVILLDIKMPDISGIEILKFVVKNSPATKVIMLTGYANLKYAMESKEHGAVDFIAKPFSLTDVLASVERVLGA